MITEHDVVEYQEYAPDGHEPEPVTDLVVDAVAGAVGGLAGALVMAGAMTMGKKLGLVEEPVPLKVERDLEQRAGLDDRTGPREEEAAAMAGHFATGAAYGAAYGVLSGRLGMPPLPAGPAYGFGVYVVNLAGLGPALGLVPPPTQEQPPAVARQVMMHLVFGVVTAKVTELARERLA
jgi:hypothetical protein